MQSLENVYNFTAIRGLQAGREYYVAMCQLKIIPKVFLFDEDELMPSLRAQRTLNRSRIPEIAAYLVDNPRSYIFSSITASIDGAVQFNPYAEDGAGQNVGSLLIPMTSRFLINDGQHRRAAIEEALKREPELGEETISVVFFVDAGLKRSQQMFADLNRHAVRPTQSIGILYDHREPLSKLARTLADEVSVFKNLTELEKTTVSIRSNKLHTLSNIYQATRTLLGKSRRDGVTIDEERLAVEFWEHVGKSIPDWQLAAQKKVDCAELRCEYVHAHGLALQAIAIVGASLLQDNSQKWKSAITGLVKIDWSRSNAKQWEGRALVAGRVSKAQLHVTLTANTIKKHLGLPLSPREKEAEVRLRESRRQAA